MAILGKFNSLIEAKFAQNPYLPQLIEEDGYFYIVIPRTKYLIQGYGKDKAQAEKDFKELVEINKQDSFIGTSWLNLKDNKKYEVVALVEHNLKWGDKYQVVANGHLIHTAISKEHILKLIEETSTQEGIAKKEAGIQAYQAQQREEEEKEKALKEKIKQLEEKEYQEFLDFPFWGEKFNSLSNRDRARVYKQFKRYGLADMVDTIVGKKMVEKEFNRRYFNRLSLREQREYERKLKENKEPYVTFMHKGEKWIKKITKTLYDLLDFSGKKREKHDEAEKKEVVQEVKEDISNNNTSINNSLNFDKITESITLNPTESKNFETLIKVADRNNPKTELNGVLIDLKERKIVATDTRRLSIMDIPKHTSKSSEPFILAKEQLYKLKKISEITLGYLDDKKVAKVTHGKGVSRIEVIDSKYPPYQRIIPSSFEKEMVIKPNKRLDTYVVDKKSMSDPSQVRLKKDTLSSLIFVGGKNKLIVFHYLEADEQDAELTRISKGYGYSKELKDYAKKYLASKAVKIGEFKTKGNFIGVKFALNKRYFDNATTIDKESKIYWNGSTLPIVIETNGVKNIIMPLTIEHLEKTNFEDITLDSITIQNIKNLQKQVEKDNTTLDAVYADGTIDRGIDKFDVGQLININFSPMMDEDFNSQSKNKSISIPALIISKNENEDSLFPSYDVAFSTRTNTGEISGYMVIKEMMVWRYLADGTPPQYILESLSESKQKGDTDWCGVALDKIHYIDEHGKIIYPASQWLQQKVKDKYKNLASLDAIETVTLSDLKKLKSAEPTEKQKESGNYKKHKTKLKNQLITIENIAGSIRSNIDSDGKRWTTKMKDHYGYFNGTLGADGDHIDVFVNSEANNQEIEGRKAYAIVQNDIITHEFDEHKIVLGATSKAHAKEIYLRNYSKDFKGFGGVELIDDLGEWLSDETEKNKKR